MISYEEKIVKCFETMTNGNNAISRSLDNCGKSVNDLAKALEENISLLRALKNSNCTD